MSKIIEKENHVMVKPGRNIMATAVDEFRAELDSLIRETPRDLTLDLTGVKMIDSRGMEVIISMHTFLKKKGNKLKVTNTTKDIFELFKFLRLDRHFFIEKGK